MLLTSEGCQESCAEKGAILLATTFQMRAGLEGAGAGPFCSLKGQQWLPSGT